MIFLGKKITVASPFRISLSFGTLHLSHFMSLYPHVEPQDFAALHASQNAFNRMQRRNIFRPYSLFLKRLYVNSYGRQPME